MSAPSLRCQLRRTVPRSSPNRAPTIPWEEFINQHKKSLYACDFFTTEVVSSKGKLVTFYVLFFIHIDSRRVHIAGITANPDETWMKQVARNVTMADIGFLSDCRFLIMDRDAKFCRVFREYLKVAGVEPVRLPPSSPNLNAHAERFVRSIKSECLSKFLFFGEESLRYVINEYVEHYHTERNHQGKNNELLISRECNATGKIECRTRLGGLLKYYYRVAV